MTRAEMMLRFPRFARIELSKAGLRDRACRLRTGTVTGYSVEGSVVGDMLIIIPDGRVVAGAYKAEHWKPISLAKLRREASVRRGRSGR